jgi:DICT domain-containing protein
MNMEAAVARAFPRPDQPYPSVFAMLRKRHPEIPTQRLTKTTLVALTHAMEDEYLARAEKAVLFGFFQQERFYRAAEARWRELSHTADFACALADFEHPGVEEEEEESPMRVTLLPDSPMRREWVLLCDSPGLSACLAGWERPGQQQTRDSEREYETLWTLEPPVVREVARVCAAHVQDVLTPSRRSSVESRLAEQPAAASADLIRANAVFRRLVDNLDKQS